MTSRNLFFDDGQSRKFWSYTLRGSKQTIRNGRLGTNGRETTKTFPSPSAAKAATEKLADQKLAKGYIAVDSGRLKIERPKGQRKATEAQVARLEKRLDARLPDDYREFLLTQNGGTPQPDHVRIPVLSPPDGLPVGFLYGLYPRPEPFQSLLFAIETILPRLPEGQLPVAGLFNLHYYSISLHQNRGCVYYWDEDAGGCDVDEDGEPVFDDSHAILVAGSFDEFLTRIALSRIPDEAEEPAGASAEEDAPKQKSSRARSQESRGKTRLSKRRQEEILRLTLEGGEELTEAIEQGEKATEKFLRKMRREITDFLKTTTSRDELQFFADNWHWEANTRPMLELVKNPHIDAGTLLQIFWHGSAEDYYLFHRSASEIDNEFEKYVFRVLRHIERRIVNADYQTASIPFDPTDWVSMADRREEFARPIPDIMYQPISGRRNRRK